MIPVVGAVAFGLAAFIGMVKVSEPRLSRRWVRRRLLPDTAAPTTPRAQEIDPLDVAAFLDTVSRGVQSGASLGHALVRASDAHPALHRFTEPIALGCMRGLDVAAAVDAVESAEWSQSERHAAQALVLASIGNAPRVTRHGASLIRELVAFEEECATRSAQAVASLRILTRSPLIVAALIVVMSADARHFLFATASGLACLTLGATAHLIGRAWMTHMIGNVAA